MPELQDLLEVVRREHTHVCPRIILGLRIGLAGPSALGLPDRQPGKHLLVVVESDGCFADGVSAASGCTVGHRTLRVEDYGKVGATFVRVDTGRALRIAPALDARARAAAWLPGEPRHYFAQLQAYQTMPDALLLTMTEVQLTVPVRALISRPAVRANCELCGEEIINEREVISHGHTFCRACAGQSYYEAPVSMALPAWHQHVDG